MTAGNLRRLMHFQKRGDVDDGWGNVTPGAGPWTTQFTAAAGLSAIRGSETVIADRLTGKQPYVVRVRQAANTKQIRPDWRLIDARDGHVYDVKSPAHDPDQKRAYLEFLVEQHLPGPAS